MSSVGSCGKLGLWEGQLGEKEVFKMNSCVSLLKTEKMRENRKPSVLMWPWITGQS